MKKYIIQSFLSTLMSLTLFGQNHYLFMSYGHAFTGAGDMQGKAFEIGYECKLKKPFSVFGSFAQSNLNSGLFLDAISANQLILGKTNLSPALLDLHNPSIGNDYSGRLPVNGSLSKSDFANYKSLVVGAKFYCLNISKLHFVLDVRCSASKIETIFETSTSRFLIIDEKAWFNNVNNTKYQPVIIPSILHDHFLDLGFGGGLALQYDITDNFKAEFNGSYSKYMKASQNLATWGIRVYYGL